MPGLNAPIHLFWSRFCCISEIPSFEHFSWQPKARFWRARADAHPCKSGEKLAPVERALRKPGDEAAQFNSTAESHAPAAQGGRQDQALVNTTGAHAPATTRGGRRERYPPSTTRSGWRKRNPPTEKPLTFRSTSCTFCRYRKGMGRCGQPSYTTHRDYGTPACRTPRRAAPMGANRYCSSTADR